MGGGDGCGSSGFRTTLWLALDVGLRAAEPQRKQASWFKQMRTVNLGLERRRRSIVIRERLRCIQLLALPFARLVDDGLIGPQQTLAENLLRTPGRRTIQKDKKSPLRTARGQSWNL